MDRERPLRFPLYHNVATKVQINHDCFRLQRVNSSVSSCTTSPYHAVQRVRAVIQQTANVGAFVTSVQLLSTEYTTQWHMCRCRPSPPRPTATRPSHRWWPARGSWRGNTHALHSRNELPPAQGPLLYCLCHSRCDRDAHPWVWRAFSDLVAVDVVHAKGKGRQGYGDGGFTELLRYDLSAVVMSIVINLIHRTVEKSSTDNGVVCFWLTTDWL